MRYDIECAAASALVAYLGDKLNAEDFANWPVVSFYDPMAVDDANRVVVICTEADSSETQEGQFEVEIEIGVKSQWSQVGLETEKATHFEKVNTVREVLNQDIDTFLSDLADLAESGVVFDYINKRKKYSTSVNQGNFYSSVTLTATCHVTE